MRTKNVDNGDGDIAPKVLTTRGARFLAPLLRDLEVWEEVRLTSELAIRFGLPEDGLGFCFRPLVTVRRIRGNRFDTAKRFEIRSTYTEGTPTVLFYQSGRQFFFDREESQKIIW